MSRNSPQPKVQTRAKRARIQSQRPLSPESTLIAPSPLNKPLEASVPTVPLLPPAPAWKHWGQRWVPEFQPTPLPVDEGIVF